MAAESGTTQGEGGSKRVRGEMAPLSLPLPHVTQHRPCDGTCSADKDRTLHGTPRGLAGRNQVFQGFDEVF